MKARGTESAKQMPGILVGQGNRDLGMQAGPKSLPSRPGLPAHTTAVQSQLAIPGSLGETGRQSGMLATDTGRNPATKVRTQDQVI